MTINASFTTHLDRWNTHCAKWDLLARGLGDDVIALSVADMEFETAPEVKEAVIHAAHHGNYGYTEVFDDFADAAIRWQRVRHGWEPQTEDIHFFPRVVQCVSALVNFIIPEEKGRSARVVTLDPAYSPLLEVCERSGTHVERVGLKNTTGEAQVDWEQLEKALTDADLLLWCNPHNPTGRVWTHSELQKLSALALTYPFITLSDDIHADFTRPGRNEYTPLAKISPELWDSARLIQCASPGKTFTIAGLETTAILTPQPLGHKLEIAKRRMGLHNPNYFAIPAVIAAWNDADSWVDELTEIIDENLTYAVKYLRTHLPHARVTDPDGTYLIWVDARHYCADEKTFEEICAHARVTLSAGDDFGSQYLGFFRINVALPTKELKEALDRLCQSIIALSTPSE